MLLHFPNIEDIRFKPLGANSSPGEYHLYLAKQSWQKGHSFTTHHGDFSRNNCVSVFEATRFAVFTYKNRL